MGTFHFVVDNIYFEGSVFQISYLGLGFHLVFILCQKTGFSRFHPMKTKDYIKDVGHSSLLMLPNCMYSKFDEVCSINN